MILEQINNANNTIKTRKTKGSEFSDIIFQFDKIKDDIYDITPLTLINLQNIFESDIILNLMESVNEKIGNERNAIILNFVLFFGGLIIGFGLEVLLSLATR